eukprot:5096758-Prorocentrum_lima.AAC.1
MKAEGKQAVSGVNLLSGLTGKAWSVVESLDPSKLVEEEETKNMMSLLDEAFLYDERTQLPREIEHFFQKLVKERNESLLSFSTCFQQSVVDLAN